MYRPAERDERAVSVIVGTLMLILVTVTAAAGLAVMVSQMQKEEMNRQTHQAAVKNELLKINGIRPVYNETTVPRRRSIITVIPATSRNSGDDESARDERGW
ncbi:MAG: hypothetical protein QFX32_05460 [Methanolinea sp.]|nr:hypothetical protein [Methanolinea sp.]